MSGGQGTETINNQVKLLNRANMPADNVRVAVTQAEPAWLNLAAGVAKTCELIAEAAKNDAKLIAFPECWIPGYPCWIW